MKKGLNTLLVFALIFSAGFASAAISDDLHLNIQVRDSSGNIVTGTFDFNFTFSLSSNCGSPLYYDNATLTTDSRGIVSHYIQNLPLNFSDQYYLCYYRDGTLKSSSKLARTPYSFNSKYLGGYSSDYFFPLNTSVAGNFDFNGGWSSGGVSIQGGNIYADTGYFYNISRLNITSLNVNGSMIPQTGFDNSFDLGSSSLRWKDLYLGGNATASWFLGYINWNNVQNAPTLLSQFTDNLGNRGYTHLSNFTNDANFVANGTSAWFSTLNVTGNSYLGNLVINADNISTNNILNLSQDQIKIWSGLNATGNIYQSGNLVCDNSNNCGYASSGSALSGVGTYGYVPMWNSTSSLNNSVIYQNGSGISIGSLLNLGTLFVNGTINASQIMVNGINVMTINQWNATNASYYLATNPFGFYNSTTLTSNSQLANGANFWNSTFATFNKTYADTLYQSLGNVTNSSYMLKTGDTATGNYTFDTNTFFIDSVNHEIGIGTTSPNKLIHAYKADDASSSIKVENDNATGTIANANLNALADSANSFLIAHGTGVTTVRYGITLGKYGELLSNGGNGLIIGTGSTAKPIIFGTNNLERMRIDSSGRVGINTTTPQNTLNVKGDLNVTGTSYLGNIVLSAQNITVDNLLNYSTAGVNVPNNFYVQGKVGIGTASPSSKLSVSGNMSILGTSNYAEVLNLGTAGLINAVVNTADEMFFNIDSDNSQTGASFHFGHNANTGNGATELMRIQDNGNVGIGTAAPTEKLSISGNLSVGDNAASNPTYDSIIWNKGDTTSGFRQVVNAANTYFGIEREYNGWHSTSTDTAFSIQRSTGNVGINTTAPSHLLNVQGTTGSTLNVSNTNVEMRIEGSNVTFLI